MSEQVYIRTKLLAMLDKSPFAPVMILMAGGGRSEVSDPHKAAVGQNAVIVVPPRGAGHDVPRFAQIGSLKAPEPA